MHTNVLSFNSFSLFVFSVNIVVLATGPPSPAQSLISSLSLLSIDDTLDNSSFTIQQQNPVQNCPTNPPIACRDPTCLASLKVPRTFRCLSRLTFISEDNGLTTLFGCPCCPTPEHYLDCNDELCQGEKDYICTTGLLNGCHCWLKLDDGRRVLVFDAGPVNTCGGSSDAEDESTTPVEEVPKGGIFGFRNAGNAAAPDGGWDAKDEGGESVWRMAVEVAGLSSDVIGEGFEMSSTWCS